MSEDINTKETLCFWCGMKPGTPAHPGKIALCPDCMAELSPKEDFSSTQQEAVEAL